MSFSCIIPYEQCYKAIENVAVSNGFVNYDIEINHGCSKGDNVMGEIWRIGVKSKNSEECLYLLLKAATMKDGVREKVPLDIIYNREIVAYDEVFKAMEGVQNTATVRPEFKFSFVRCYYTSEDHMKELLVLEDLKFQGFEMLDKNKGLDIEHTKLVVTSLAKLHALSFILKEREPEKYMNLINKINFDTQSNYQEYANFIRTSLELAAKVVKNGSHKSKILQIRNNYFDDWKRCLQVESYGVICHGDCWTNNILFKKKDKKPVDARFIDCQVMRYAPPATDLLFFFFTSTDGDLRRAHYASCLNLYHETLADVLKAYSYNVEDVFPRNEFYTQVKKVSKFAFISGVSACTHMVLDAEDNMGICDLISGQEMAPPTGAAFDRYVKKLTDIICDCIEFGYL